MNRAERLAKLQRRRRNRQLRNFAVVGLLLFSGVNLWRQYQLNYLTPPHFAQPSLSVSESIDWFKELEKLDSCRSALFSEQKLEMVGECSAVDSPVFKADQAAIQHLAEQNIEIAGLQFKIHSIEQISRRESNGLEFVQLRVSDRLGATDLQINGQPKRTQERPLQTWRITLVKSADQPWLYYEIKKWPIRS